MRGRSLLCRARSSERVARSRDLRFGASFAFGGLPLSGSLPRSSWDWMMYRADVSSGRPPVFTERAKPCYVAADAAPGRTVRSAPIWARARDPSSPSRLRGGTAREQRAKARPRPPTRRGYSRPQVARPGGKPLPIPDRVRPRRRAPSRSSPAGPGHRARTGARRSQNPEPTSALGGARHSSRDSSPTPRPAIKLADGTARASFHVADGGTEENRRTAGPEVSSCGSSAHRSGQLPQSAARSSASAACGPGILLAYSRSRSSSTERFLAATRGAADRGARGRRPADPHT